LRFRIDIGLRNIDRCGCQKKEKKKVAHPTEGKVQQSGARPRESESIAKEGGSQREVRRTFKMLREVWMSIGVKKLDTHEGITVRALLDSSATRMFMDKRMVARHGFKLQKLERPIMVRNMVSQTSFGHISTKSSTIPTVSKPA